jgi:hypothetical protein
MPTNVIRLLIFSPSFLLVLLSFPFPFILAAGPQEGLLQLVLRKRLSEEVTQAAARRFRPNNSSLQCSRNSLLNVILASDPAAKLTLLEVTPCTARGS